MEKIVLNKESFISQDVALPDVLQYVVSQKYFTGTDIQKQFGLGYPRVARMIDILQENGFVSEPFEKKCKDKIKVVRKSLISKRQYKKLLMDNQK